MDHSKHAGFTLVEIMMTMGILAFLLSMGALAVSSSMNKARKKEAKAELEMIAGAVLRQAWDTGTFPNGRSRSRPGSFEVWDLDAKMAGLTALSSFREGWNGPYYDGETVDPWGNPYFFDPDYKVNGESRAVVGSFGPNGVGRNLYDEDDVYVLLDD